MYTLTVRVFSARVQGGAIVPAEKVSLPEGTTVTVIADAEEKAFEIGVEDESELLDAIAEVERGEIVRAADLLDRLPR